ncbi:hypothetical protein AVEN_53787-1 [Araneus ventricosus]|uniref:Uncharacterized protein n=1 Tax=Araneus ventricosus TaxID=182803 RepID=A0A4Y2SET9_ARAVE|nr:hypothetical protein AVEN_53787-1 [Araneus ventricosus]
MVNFMALVPKKPTQPTNLKLRAQFYDPYKITTVKPNDRYDDVKIGCHDGQNNYSRYGQNTYTSDYTHNKKNTILFFCIFQIHLFRYFSSSNLMTMEASRGRLRMAERCRNATPTM